MSHQSHLVLIRHGESIYNEKNLFTGWEDVELTQKGIGQAHAAANLIQDIDFTHAFTSKLKRARNTLDIILKDLNQYMVVTENRALNERDYGSLVGKNKLHAAEKYGKEQVQLWRRSYSNPPPYGESLEMTAKRSIPYYQTKIEPLLKGDNKVIVSAHGNSIRSIIMYLHNLDSKQILKTEIGWCEPWIYTFTDGIQTEFKIVPRTDSESKSHLPKT